MKNTLEGVKYVIDQVMRSCRQKLVVMKTEVKNRVHTLVDRLFPGFLNEKNIGINAFSESSLVLMQDRFSAQQIRRRKQL